MDPREKVLHAFDKIVESGAPTKHLVFDFLKGLYHFVNESIFIIAENEDFTIKNVEGVTFFDAHSRTLYLGDAQKNSKTSLFETLVSMMQFYEHLATNPGYPSGFKKNPETRLVLDYVGMALAKYFLGDYTWPDPSLEAYLRTFGLIDDLLLIRVFSQRFTRLVEYEGDFEKLLTKIQETIAIYNEIQETPDEDAAMLDAMVVAGGDGKEPPSGPAGPTSDEDRLALLKSLLEGISLD